MEHVRLEHPPDRWTLCDHSDCEEMPTALRCLDNGSAQACMITSTSLSDHKVKSTSLADDPRLHVNSGKTDRASFSHLSGHSARNYGTV